MISLTLPLVAIGYAMYITLKLRTARKRLKARLSRLDLERSILLEPKDFVFRVLSIVILVVAILASQIPLQQVGLASQNVIEDLFIGVGLGFALRWFLDFALNRMYVVSSQETECNLVLKGILPRSSLQKWLLMTVVLPIGGFLEELYFRGILIGGFSSFTGLYGAAIISTLFFAFSHLAQGKYGFLGSGFSGAVLAIIFLWRSSLLPLFIAHYVGDAEPLSKLLMVQQPDLKALTLHKGKVIALTHDHKGKMIALLPEQLEKLLEERQKKHSCR
jgi:membrane protease YdiL (CAAX protease family)